MVLKERLFEVCRVCLFKRCELVSLSSLFEKTNKMAHFFREFTNINIFKEEDKNSVFVCHECSPKLRDAWKLRERIKMCDELYFKEMRETSFKTEKEINDSYSASLSRISSVFPSADKLDDKSSLRSNSTFMPVESSTIDDSRRFSNVDFYNNNLNTFDHQENLRNKTLRNEEPQEAYPKKQTCSKPQEDIENGIETLHKGPAHLQIKRLVNVEDFSFEIADSSDEDNLEASPLPEVTKVPKSREPVLTKNVDQPQIRTAIQFPTQNFTDDSLERSNLINFNAVCTSTQVAEIQTKPVETHAFPTNTQPKSKTAIFLEDIIVADSEEDSDTETNNIPEIVPFETFLPYELIKEDLKPAKL